MGKQFDKGAMRQKRARLHQQTAPGVGRIRYVEVGVPGQSQRCARVVPGETLNLADFIRRLCDRNPGMAPMTAKFYLETAFAELAECLREGRFVTFEGIAHFGVSIKGTLNAGERQLNETHALRPWARFLQPFANAVNDGAYLAPVGQLPVKVAFKRVTAQGRMLVAEGAFRAPEEVNFTMVPPVGSKSVPCDLMDADTSTTRLYFRATTDFPAASTLLARYFDVTGEVHEVQEGVEAAP